ncbi:cytochrome c oxidase subunit II [Rossellomorea sp. SC111]|uniref:cytochrome c oxidase subunit II n=1 Tax=Rossellomorea sp. SC111 TaxID=2968985 RepID=UPI00215AD169|nr:cytochrome c oxidase subunit II [Rossellomorea sp. SC111]MCR8849285.1 cytochrome c oxidase subunit II [Rossellomorea sp. SC111]
MKRLCCGILLTVLFLTGCSSLKVLDPKGTVAELQLNLFQISIAIMLFVFFVVFSMFVYFTWKYRETPERRHVNPSYVKGNRKLEVTWTVIPILLLVILAVPTLKGTFSLAESDETSENPLTIEVTGHQYWWEVHYPDQGITLTNEAYIPVDRPVVFRLRSEDVIHSFWMPRLGGKKDLIPGKTNTLTLNASEEGVYKGQCAELCGASHSYMRFQVHAVGKQKFSKWADQMSQEKEPETLDPTAEKGKKLFISKCLTCHAVSPAERSKGPNLAGFADKERIGNVLLNTDENVEKWIKDPSSFKPDINMPPFPDLTEEDLEALSTYLSQLE